MGKEGKPTTDEHESIEIFRNVTEYFLSKLKRIDGELNVANAELREVKEEIRTRDDRINYLNMKLSDLLREESKKAIRKLESTKADLEAISTRADKVLGGLGLIWVGENARRDPMACCTSTNENYMSLKRISPLRKSVAGIHQSHNRINTSREPVVPFSGVGYRLGTGSEVYGYESDPIVSSSRETKSAIVEATEDKASPLVGGLNHRVKRVQNAKTVPVEPVSAAFSAHQKANDVSGRITDQTKFRCTKKVEELPAELLQMSMNERRSVLKQMSVQIQKNMDKYSY
ncbi:hypothetical protein GE061_014560 [Apolygus lucorum]|uniref:Uncharacterized protein n=1 Tax=Apolygus lucorum TaxID=248454 RepID=A0A8S9XJQ6_APOLU|nr:hypothetical protein GE061_014560 [Apolygus lucorum]